MVWKIYYILPKIDLLVLVISFEKLRRSEHKNFINLSLFIQIYQMQNTSQPSNVQMKNINKKLYQ